MGGFPQTAGLIFTIDAIIPYDKGEMYAFSTSYRPHCLRRVTIESINGQPFSKDDVYAIVTNDYIAAGGDSYGGLFPAIKNINTGIPVNEALIEYIRTQLNGVIGSKYAKPRGDITIITS